jgi:hypothetical protein
MPTGGHGPRYGITVSPADNAEERVSSEQIKQECVLLTRVGWWSYRSGKHGTLRKIYRHQIKTASFLKKKKHKAGSRTRPFDNNSENKQMHEFHGRY